MKLLLLLVFCHGFIHSVFSSSGETSERCVVQSLCFTILLLYLKASAVSIAVE